MRLKKDKSGDTVGRPSWKSSLLGDPGAKFFCGKPQHMKNSLNFASTCLKVVDTRRYSVARGWRSFQLLLSIVTGVSNHQLYRIFLLDRSAIAAIRHDFQTRYSSTFFWLDKFFRETAANGFASAHGRRRYFDGLRISRKVTVQCILP